MPSLMKSVRFLRKNNTNAIQTLPEKRGKNFSQTHFIRPTLPWCQNKTKTLPPVDKYRCKNFNETLANLIQRYFKKVCNDKVDCYILSVGILPKLIWIFMPNAMVLKDGTFGRLLRFWELTPPEWDYKKDPTDIPSFLPPCKVIVTRWLLAEVSHQQTPNTPVPWR